MKLSKQAEGSIWPKVSAYRLAHLLFRNAKNTGDLYGVTALDDDWVTLNQMIKYYKFGFGRASDYVNEMIRLGSIDRMEGIAIIEEYDGKCSDKYISDFCEFIGITTQHFWNMVVSVTNKDLFQVKNKIIKRKFRVGTGVIQ